MKWTLISTLIASASIHADDGECYVDPPCCDMGHCDLSMGRQCVEYECYMPSFYDMSCGSGRFLRLEYLRWFGRDTNQAFALTATALPSLPDTNPSEATYLIEPTKYHYLKSKWENGLRITMGRHSSCDGWDSNLSWTYYRNRTKASASVPPFSSENPALSPIAQKFIPGANQQVLINPWINQSFTPDNQLSSFYFTEVSAKSTFSISQIDLELGKKYWLSRCFALRPFIGGRAVAICNKFETSSFNVSGPLLDKFTNKTEAVGLLGGAEPSFYLTENFVLFGKFDLSLVWGRNRSKKKEDYSFQPDPETPPRIDYSHKMNNRFYGMTAALGSQGGLRWEVCWCGDQFRTAIDVGWEQNIWYDQSTRLLTFQNSTNAGLNTFNFFDEINAHLTMGGLFISAQLDF